MVRVWLAIFGLLALPSLVCAQTSYTWKGPPGCSPGACGGDWTDPNNWDPSGVPGKDDEATIAGRLPFGQTPTGVTNAAGSVKSLKLSDNVDLPDCNLTIGDGGLTWIGGQVSGTLVLSAGGTSTIAGDVHLGGGEIDNHGTLLWTLGKLSGDDSAAIRNSGVMTVSGGTSLGYVAGTSDADIYNEKGATFTYTGPGTLSSADGYWGFHNAGTAIIASGAFELHNTGNTKSTLDDGGTVSGAGTLRFVETTDGEYGAVQLNGTTTIAKGATIELAVGADLTGSGTFNGPGTLLWTGGSIHGGTTAAPVVFGQNLVVKMTGPDVKNMASGVIENRGTVRWDGGDFGGSGDSLFTNRGTFTASGDLNVNYSPEGGPNTSTFANYGTFTKATGKNALVVQSWAFENHGTLAVTSGRVELQSPGNLVHVFHDGSTLQGYVRIAETQAYSNVTAKGTTMLAAGSKLELGPKSEIDPVKAVFAGTGTTVFAGGSLAVADKDSMRFDCPVKIVKGMSGSVIAVSDAGSCTFAGATTWSDGALQLSNGTILNTGTFAISKAGEFTTNSSDTQFLNQGKLISNPGTGTVQLDMIFSNSGTVESRSGKLLFAGYADGTYTQTQGALRLVGGSVGAYVPGDQTTPNDPRVLNLSGGRLEGTGEIDAQVVNAGVIAPGGRNATGALQILQTFEQKSGGTLEIELQSASGFDALNVTGDVTLAGGLDVSILPGTSLKAGDSFPVINSKGQDALSGKLTLQQPSDASLTATYHTHDLTLGLASVMQPPPPVEDAGAGNADAGDGDAGVPADASDAGADGGARGVSGAGADGGASEHHGSSGCSVQRGGPGAGGLAWLALAGLFTLCRRGSRRKLQR